MAILILVAATVWRRHVDSPEQASQRFYNGVGVTGEDETMDPLIVAGDKVVPLVIKEIQNKNMPHRRHEIAFLGNGSYRAALPALRSILQNDTEIGYHRGDALESIYLINSAEADSYAQRYANTKGFLGDTARAVISGDTRLSWRRSYQDALMHRHG